MSLRLIEVGCGSHTNIRIDERRTTKLFRQPDWVGDESVKSKASCNLGALHGWHSCRATNNIGGLIGSLLAYASQKVSKRELAGEGNTDNGSAGMNLIVTRLNAPRVH